MVAAYFQDFGRRLASEWASRHFDTDAFPDLACNAIEQARVADVMPAEALQEWVLLKDELPFQGNLDHTFGEPPVTVFWHPHFYVEALHWTTGTPEIHQHGFSGAFGVWAGSSVQSRFAFEAETRFGAALLVGSLQLRDVKLLSVGSVEPIRAGTSLIHSVFHLDCPSVTLVVRTHADVEHQPQYSYQRPGLAVDPFHKDPRVVRRLQMLRYLDELHADRFTELATSLLQCSEDLYCTYRVLEFLRFGAKHSGPFDPWRSIAKNRHGTIIDHIGQAFDERDRTVAMVSRRALVKNADHRFLLALLLNLRSRDAILRIVEERCPNRDPRDVVARWAFDLSAGGVTGIDFNEPNRAVFRWLMEGLPVSKVVALLESTFDFSDEPDHALQLKLHCANIRGSIFGPVLQEAIA
jgi:hypothetical protein